jgi:hypothetical protein
MDKINIYGDWEDMIFTAHNPTASDIYFDFFKLFPLYQIGGNVPNTNTGGFFINGSSNYNTTVRDFFNAPAWVRRIYIYSDNQENFNQVITHVYKDANGVEVKIPLIPSLSVGVNQFQSGFGELDFPDGETVFGINQWFEDVLIKSGSELKMLLIYKQIDKSQMLSTVNKADLSLNNRTYSEQEIQKDYIMKGFIVKDENTIKPFDFSVLK